MAAPAACMAPPPSPRPKSSSAPGRIREKLRHAFGGLKDEAAPEPQAEEIRASDRKAVERAIEALPKALEAAKADLAAGRIPNAASIEQARKALLKELASSPLGTDLAALQQLLRTGLLELVAALSMPGVQVSALAPLLERCLLPLASASRFWEAMI